MAKKKDSQIKKRARLHSLKKQLAEALEEQESFRQEHETIVDTWEELCERAASLTEAVKAEFKLVLENHKPGTTEDLRVGNLQLTCIVKEGKREFDTVSLIEDYPDLVDWEGMFSVKASEYDKAIASGLIEDPEEYVERGKPILSVSIRAAEDEE